MSEPFKVGDVIERDGEQIVAFAPNETEANELADRWRVALRNIDGPEHELEAKWIAFEYCVPHDCMLRGVGHRTCWHVENGPHCKIRPLFFRDIKDKEEAK